MAVVNYRESILYYSLIAIALTFMKGDYLYVTREYFPWQMEPISDSDFESESSENEGNHTSDEDFIDDDDLSSEDESDDEYVPHKLSRKSFEEILSI